MVDIVQYRQRIGTFNQKILRFKFPKYEVQKRPKNNGMKSLMCSVIKWMKILVISLTIFSLTSDSNLQTCSYKPSSKSTFVNPGCSYRNDRFDNNMRLTGNFYARYLHGNRKLSPKGVKAYHLNIRSLQNKVWEVKKITTEIKPHILGLSEC